MKSKFFILLFITALIGCNSENFLNYDKDDKSDKEHLKDKDDEGDKSGTDKVLLIKMGYQTNEFEGGVEFVFSKRSEDFTIDVEYSPANDFGYVKMIYKELSEPLFEGTIHWMGKGTMIYPEELLPPDSFIRLITCDYVYPINGFENIFNPQCMKLDYDRPWGIVQTIAKVKTEYMVINRTQKVKVFLYTPSIGDGNTEDWSWIFFLKY